MILKGICFANCSNASLLIFNPNDLKNKIYYNPQIEKYTFSNRKVQFLGFKF